MTIRNETEGYRLETRHYQIFAVFSLLLVMTLPFTNCDNSSSANGLFNTLSTACQTDATGYNPCTVQDSQLVQLQVNTGSIILLPAVVTLAAGYLFDVAGDCNEGGYLLGNGNSRNVINYQLYVGSVGGTVVSNSDGVGWTTGTGNHYTQCQNGRFSITVSLPIILPVGTDLALRLQILVYDNNGVGLTPNGFTDTRVVTVRAASN